MNQLDPRSQWVFFISAILRSLPIMVFLIVFMLMKIASMIDPNLTVLEPAATTGTLAPMLLVLVVIASGIWARYTYIFYKYELREDGFRKEHGIIWKRYVTIPYDRIQNVDIYRGLLARIFGVSDLQVQTAGGITSASYGAFSEGRLPGLDKLTAEKLRDELVAKARSTRGQGV